MFADSHPVLQGLLSLTSFEFYVDDLWSVDDFVELIDSVRQAADESGLRAFPQGVPFTFWEQYINLRMFVAQNLGVALCTLCEQASTSAAALPHMLSAAQPPCSSSRCSFCSTLVCLLPVDAARFVWAFLTQPWLLHAFISFCRLCDGHDRSHHV